MNKHRRELAQVQWEGDSLQVLSAFPDTVRSDLGFALFELQQGKQPAVLVRRMESIGDGVFELKEGDERTWHRVIYLSRIDDVIYVLHCFEKDSRKTDRRDLNIAKKRLSKLRRRIDERKKHEKRFGK